MIRKFISILMLNLFLACAGLGQSVQAPQAGPTTAFSYQGRLMDGAVPAAANYDFQFALFDQLSGGTQQGATLTKSAVPVTNGIFTVTLDFGNQFPGADRFLDIMVKKSSDPTYSPLTPRQPITTSPYSIRTLGAGAADSLAAACVGCVTDANVGSGISYSKLSGAPTSLPPNGAAGGDLTGSTYPNPVIANIAITSAKIAPNAVTVAKLPAGATSTTFLRGDGTWATPAASQTDMFNVVGTCPNNATVFFGLSGTGTVFSSAALPNDARGTVMGYSGTATGLFLRGFERTGGVGTNNVTIQVYKNNALQMSATLVANTANAYFTASNTANTFTFSAGDNISYVMTQSNPAPIIVEISVTLVVVH